MTQASRRSARAKLRKSADKLWTGRPTDSKPAQEQEQPDPELSPLPEPHRLGDQLWTKAASLDFQTHISQATNQRGHWLLFCLRGTAVKTANCIHGNHVLRHAFERLPADSTIELARELQADRGVLLCLCRNIYACRVLNAMLQHQHPRETAPLLSILIDNFQDLARNEFGNYVLQEAVEQTPFGVFQKQAHGEAERLLARLEVTLASPINYAWDVVAAVMNIGPVPWRLELSAPVLCASSASWLAVVLKNNTNMRLACQRLAHLQGIDS